MKLVTSTRQTAEIGPSLDKITRLSQNIVTLTRKSMTAICGKPHSNALPTLNDIDDMIRLQLMLSTELSRLYAVLDPDDHYSIKSTRDL
ncbi:hypothetical protein AFLA_007678 [Aspergillus flavus NRRL3357]|nr:hypothetical protein AFLA_007678 [Aspergillus flavus NRRL3357]